MYSEEIVARYTEGDCHLLAQAIHDLTGWQIAAILDSDYCGHVFVMVPNTRRCLDVTGVTHRRKLHKSWSWYGDSKIVKLDSIRDLVRHGWEARQIDLETRMVAAELVQEFFPEKG